MGMYVYISQRKYIPYLTSIHALSPYELSHTIIPVTCVYNWFNNGYNHFICTSSFIIFILCTVTNIYSTKSPIQITAPTSTDYYLPNLITSSPLCNAKSLVNNVHFNFNGISHISAIGLVPIKNLAKTDATRPRSTCRSTFSLPTACRR